MQIRWGNKKTGTPLPSDVQENAAETIIRERHFATVIDQIIANETAKGAFDDLEGKGKPLDLSGQMRQDDYLNKVLKNANVLPDWLELQHKIRDAIAKLERKIERDPTANYDNQISLINKDIQKYNQICPNTIFQKSMLTRETVSVQLKRWE